jgi:hypothetical protein
LELLEEATTPQVVVILIGLAQEIAHFQVRLIVVRPVFLATVDWNAAVGALEVYVGRRCAALRIFTGFEITRIVRGPSGFVVGVRAIGMLSHKSRTLSDLWDG